MVPDTLYTSRVATLALSVVLASLGACRLLVDDAESTRLRSLLRQSVAAVTELSAARTDGPRTQTHAAPAIPEILRAITARDIAALERLLGGLPAAHEDGKLALDALWRVFRLFDIVIPGALPTLDVWVTEQPQSHAARVARGRQYAALGWQARGTKYAHETSSSQFREMARLHILAVEDLRVSLRSTRTPFLAIETLMGIAQGAGDEQMVAVLFEEGIRAMPRNFPLYRARMMSLEPRWGGSLAAMTDLVARAENDILSAGEIAWLRTWVFLEEHDAEIRSNPRAAVSYAVMATEMDNRAPRWRHRSAVERDHGFLEEALASASRAIALDPEDYEGWADRARLHEKRGAMADARADYERGARLGSHYAQERVIRALVYGELAMKRDYAAAREWCEFAAAMANPWGDFCIGGLYFDGLGGLPKDATQGFDRFLRAAEQGHATAQHDVGWMLVQGRGVAQNRDQGIEWLRKAARQNHEYAKAKLQQLGVPIDPAPSLQAWLREVFTRR